MCKIVPVYIAFKDSLTDRAEQVWDCNFHCDYHFAQISYSSVLNNVMKFLFFLLQEIKIEPVDIDISNDSVDPVDDGFDINKVSYC